MPARTVFVGAAMRRGLALTLILICAIAGCKASEKRSDADSPLGGRPGDFSSRPKDIRDLHDSKEPGGHWLEGPYTTRPALNKPPRGNAPPADSHVDPSDPYFDTKAETRGVIAGFVFDPEGRKAGKLYVQIEPLPSDGTGAPLEVETLADGSFLMKGLEPGRSYRLTCRATDGSRVMAGRTDARAPNAHVRLTLIEGLSLEDAKPARGAVMPPRRTVPGGSLPPVTNIPRTEAPPPLSPGDRMAPLPTPNFSSTAPLNPLPSPLAHQPEHEAAPKIGDLPLTGEWTPTGPGFSDPARTAPVRPDLTTTGPGGDWRAPTTTIPGPGRPTDPPAPPPLVPLPTPVPDRSRSQAVKPINRFVLLDSQGKSRSFPSGNDGDLILLDFMTTSCLPCQKALPTLVELQRKFGARGLEIVGVACDDEPRQTRLAVAERYRADHELNYGMYTELGRRPGELMQKFGVDRYPTVVLLDSNGAVLWQGHPAKKDQLIAVIEEQIQNRTR